MTSEGEERRAKGETGSGMLRFVDVVCDLISAVGSSVELSDAQRRKQLGGSPARAALHGVALGVAMPQTAPRILLPPSKRRAGILGRVDGC